MALLLPSRQWAEASGWRAMSDVVEEYYGPDDCSSQDMLREPHAATMAEVFRRVLRARQMA